MSNVQLDPGSGGAVVRTIQKASVQYPVSILDVGNHTEDNNGTASFVSKASHVGMPIEGLEDDGNAVQGAPVLIGAKYSTSTTSATNGAVSTIRVDSQSNIRTSIFGANTDNGLSIDASGGITVSGISSIDYDTRAGLDNVDMQACVGLVVPSATGAQEVVSSSFVNRSGGSDADPTAGLNVSQIGAFFFDGDNDNTDETTNVAAFGIAIASATGPKAIGSDGTSTTYLPVSVGNFPTTQTVSGNVSVSNFPATQPVSGSVSVSNFPATQAVSGTVGVSNFPATQAVSGTVTASVSNFPATQTVSGSVSVSNFPATQPVSGAVSVSNFPATQTVSGTVTASVSNFPATQTVSGSVSVSNFPATQPVSGAVSVSNFPATQPVSGNVGVTSISGGTNAIGDVGLVGRNNTGLTFATSIDVDENKDSLPSGSTTLYGITAFNSTSSPIYLKFWDEASLSVNVGTTVPDLTFLIPANASSNGAGFVLNIPQGIAFSAQCVFAATTGVESTSTSGPATNGCIVNLFYKQ